MSDKVKLQRHRGIVIRAEMKEHKSDAQSVETPLSPLLGYAQRCMYAESESVC